MPLTDVVCRGAKPGAKRRKLSDGGGLQLWVMPNGSRLWRFLYRYSSEQKTLTIGTYPEVSLAEARERRETARLHLRDGKDPQVERKKAILAEQEKQNAQDTFGKIARELVAKWRREGLAETTLIKKEWLLEMAMPALEDMQVREIRPIDALRVLQEVEARGIYETARRLRSIIGQVCRYAIVTARADNDPTMALRGAITTPTVRSYAAITDPVKFGGLLRAINGFDGQPQTVSALKLLALLFPRPGELRMAEWPEFDLGKCVWTIPAPKMKMRREHHIPLPTQAVAVLTELRNLSGHMKYVFPNLLANNEKPLCENALNAALRRMGYGKEEMTSHGFRSSASSLLNESGKWNPDAIERQLAHVDSNSVRRIYSRSSLWDERVQMMQWWADYLDQLRKQVALSKVMA